MVRRNLELEREAIEAIRKRDALEREISESSRESSSVAGSGGGSGGGIDMDEELQAAMQASLLEYEEFDLRQKEEMAELEEVIAQSLVLEKERVRLVDGGGEFVTFSICVPSSSSSNIPRKTV